MEDLKPTPLASIPKPELERLVALPDLKDVDGNPVVVRIRRVPQSELALALQHLQGGQPTPEKPEGEEQPIAAMPIAEQLAIVQEQRPRAYAIAIAGAVEPELTQTAEEGKLDCSFFTEDDLFTLSNGVLELSSRRVGAAKAQFHAGDGVGRPDGAGTVAPLGEGSA